MKPNWREEVRKFRNWATLKNQQSLEWEQGYESWPAIFDATEELLHLSPQLWSANEIEDLLYILARNWSHGHIAYNLLPRFPEATFHLASKSLDGCDADARWQLAEVLGQLAPDARIEPLLLAFANDKEEYVRRRTLRALASLGSLHAEQLALREWNREDEHQQWARMNALSCWEHINSPFLESHLREAETSNMEYLADYARRLRNGEVQFV